MRHMTREEQQELRENTALELLADVMGATPEQDDPRLGYVTVQIDRTLWLRIQALPQPPFIHKYPPLIGDPLDTD